ncbi:hypothetical protein J6590_059474 [Homalodisca vitripennis]|nr:hypothetical protein J6590_059474 [Homalodisca vitripennis]
MPVDPAVLASLDVEGELEACDAKLNLLSASIDEYEGEYTDTEGQRLQARLWHNYLRIQRIPVVTEADEGCQRNLLSEAKRLCDAASEQRGAVEMGSEDDKEIVDSEPITNKTQPLRATAPVAANQANVGDSTPSPADQRTQPVSSSVVPPAPHDSYHRPRAVPVYKWGLIFDGRSQSVGAFLHRVEELRRDRGDLEVVFQPPDHDIRLQQENFNRMQGETESIDLFIASMEGLYGRLATNVPEEARLRQMYHNLNPQLRDRLALFDVTSIEQLRKQGRKAEAGRFRDHDVMEPDLAYTPVRRRPTRDAAHSQPDRKIFQTARQADGMFKSSKKSSSDKLVCWRCNKVGHMQRDCRVRLNKNGPRSGNEPGVSGSAAMKPRK